MIFDLTGIKMDEHRIPNPFLMVKMVRNGFKGSVEDPFKTKAIRTKFRILQISLNSWGGDMLYERNTSGLSRHRIGSQRRRHRRGRRSNQTPSLVRQMRSFRRSSNTQEEGGERKEEER